MERAAVGAAMYARAISQAETTRLPISLEGTTQVTDKLDNPVINPAGEIILAKEDHGEITIMDDQAR